MSGSILFSKRTIFYGTLVCLLLGILCVYLMSPQSSVGTLDATTQSIPACGNDIVDAGEECDGHEREKGVYCNEDCTLMLLE